MNKGNWSRYLKCECGYAEGPLTVHVAGKIMEKYRIEPCPSCGNDGPKLKPIIQRWVSQTSLLSPTTWGKGHWEISTKPDPLRNPVQHSNTSTVIDKIMESLKKNPDLLPPLPSAPKTPSTPSDNNK